MAKQPTKKNASKNVATEKALAKKSVAKKKVVNDNSNEVNEVKTEASEEFLLHKQLCMK